MSVRYPLTRARISTYSLAANCPVYSSHSTSSRWTGWLTVTAGGAAGSSARGCVGYQDPRRRISAASGRNTVTGYRVIVRPFKVRARRAPDRHCRSQRDQPQSGRPALSDGAASAGYVDPLDNLPRGLRKSAAKGSLLPGDDALDLIDSDPVEACDLLRRHPVSRQGAHPTVLGDRYIADLWPDRRPSPYLLRLGRCSRLRRPRRHLRRDGEDAWLAPRLGLGWRRGIGS